jgi:hypothetical protein
MLTSGRGREARIHYLAGTFRMLGAGDHVRCAETGTHIPLEHLRYWSVERQEAYIDADAAHAAERRAAAGGTGAR